MVLLYVDDLDLIAETIIFGEREEIELEDGKEGSESKMLVRQRSCQDSTIRMIRIL